MIASHDRSGIATAHDLDTILLFIVIHAIASIFDRDSLDNALIIFEVITIAVTLLHTHERCG